MIHYKKMEKISEEVLRAVENAVFPPACPICGKPRVIKNGIRLNICPWCRERITYVDEPACLKCGKKLDDDREYCTDCQKIKHVYNQAVSLYEYSDDIKQSIYRFKYHNKQEYAGVYAEELARKCGQVIRNWNPDIIMPVPIHASKLKQRGYNQAALIARELARLIGIAVDEQYIRRVRKTLPMKELNNSERVKNLQNAFQIYDNGIIYNKVLIVDDIYTTGATIDACARCLKDYGVKSVYAVTLCIGKGF